MANVVLVAAEKRWPVQVGARINSGPRFKGIGRYDAATGHGMSLFFPENRADWNGKLFVTDFF